MLDPIWITVVACPALAFAMFVGIRIGKHNEQKRAANAGAGRWEFEDGEPTRFIYEGED